MKKQQQEEIITPFITHPSANTVHWGVHYIRDKKGNWNHERLSINCEQTMQSLVKKWKSELDSHGIYMGTILGNKYPDITPYDELNLKL